MEKTQEVRLLERVRCFDHQALAEMYDIFSPGLYAYAFRLLGDGQQAEDCVAETFSRFLQVLQAGKGPREYLQAYLYRIAHNWITDQYRRQPLPPLALDEDSAGSVQEHPEHETLERLEREQVRAALRRLTVDQRQVVMLRFIEDWELEAVASALQKPVGAVKALQHRALAALKRMLIRQNEETHENLA